jgi:hypothetical protein
MVDCHFYHNALQSLLNSLAQLSTLTHLAEDVPQLLKTDREELTRIDTNIDNI